MIQTRWWQGLAVAAFWAVAFAAAAPGYVHRYHIPMPAVIGIYCCFVLTVTLVVTPAVSDLHGWRPKPFLLPVLWCLPYFAYAAGTKDFHWLSIVRLLVVCIPLPILYSLLPVRNLKRFSWQDLAVALWLIAVVLSNQLKGIWTVPANLDFMGRLFVISIASWSWTFVRPVPNLGYSFSLSRKVLGASAINFCLFALVAIPSSLALQFTEWNPRWHGIASFCIDYLGIFLFIALLEETFFRGFLQTLLSENMGSATRAQILVSCLFGVFHILHAPFPNWRYVLLATIAGWFYGNAFRQGGNVMASAIAHAMVDTTWRTLFSKS